MRDHSKTAQIYRFVGRRVRDLRTDRGLTQARLAKRIGTARTTITNLESGTQGIPLHHLFAIAEVLGVEVAELIPRHDALDAAPRVGHVSGIPAFSNGAPAELSPHTARLISSLLSEAEEELHG